MVLLFIILLLSEIIILHMYKMHDVSYDQSLIYLVWWSTVYGTLIYTAVLQYITHILQDDVKSLGPGDAYVSWYTMSTLVQLMACRLSGTINWTNSDFLSSMESRGKKLQ